MRYALIFIAVVLASCKKENTATTVSSSLSETHWNLFYKNNNTFTFFAESEIYFKSNDSTENYRNFDTLHGSWTQTDASMSIHFTNGDEYTGTIVSSDSIVGTLTASGNHGTWYAKRK